RGIAEAVVLQAVETATSEVSTADLLRQQLLRRFSSFDYATADSRERRRVVSFFQRRGFSLEQIFTILKEVPEDRSNL
ncbi:MAG: RecX family transcriptional regulator, partial [Desulfuromonadales bacterium]|nr:RecX family transcriptional regulator [Desulfuromonadales bacterium]